MRKVRTLAALAALGLLLPATYLAGQETEPNNSIETAQPIALGDTVAGLIADVGDLDYFALDLQAGAYDLNISYPGGVPEWPDWFRLVDANNNEIPCFCYYGPDGSITALFKVCADQTLFFEAGANQEFGLTNTSYQAIFTADLVDPEECNDTPALARLVSSPGEIGGRLPLPGDEDWLRLSNVQPGPLLVGVNMPDGPALDVALFADPATDPIATGLSIQTGIGQAGDYFLRIRFADPDTASAAAYIASLAFFNGCSLDVDSTAVVLTPGECGQAAGSVALPAPDDGTPPLRYRLGEVEQTAPVFTNLEAGNYQALITDANGCTASFTVDLSCIDDACPETIAAFRFTREEGRTVRFTSQVQNARVLSWNFGDGSTAQDANPLHTYNANGLYTVTLNLLNECNNQRSTVTREIAILLGDFRLGDAVGAPGDTVCVPLILEGEFDGPIAAVDGQVILPQNIAQFTGFSPGVLNTDNVTLNPTDGRFIALFDESGREGAVPGDTLFCLRFVLQGEPCDSSVVDLNGALLPFAVSTLLGNQFRQIQANLTPGQIALRCTVELLVQAWTRLGEPVAGAEVIVVHDGGETMTTKTNTDGEARLTVPYGENLRVSMTKDTVVRAGISSADPFYYVREIVGLPIPYNGPLFRLSADVNCDGLFSTLDVVTLLRWLVGLQDMPCNQVLFVPRTHAFPAVNDPEFYDVPNEVLITDPELEETVVFDVVVRGDAEGDVNPGGHNPEVTVRSEVEWTYEVETLASGQHRVSIYAGASMPVGGLLHLDIGENHLQQAFLADGLFMINDQEPRALHLAFLSRTGQTLQVEPGRPLLELLFDRPDPGSKLSVLPGSEIVESGGARRQLSLRPGGASVQTETSVRLYPNPASDWLQIKAAADRVEILDTRGVRVLTAQPLDGRAEVHVGSLPAGIYHCRLFFPDGSVETKKIVVL